MKIPRRSHKYDNTYYKENYICSFLTEVALGNWAPSEERLEAAQKYVSNVLNENLSKEDAYITLLPISTDKKYRKKLEKLITKWAKKNYDLPIQKCVDDRNNNENQIVLKFDIEEFLRDNYTAMEDK